MAATETPAAILRRASDKLRHLASIASPGPWKTTGIGDYGWTISMPNGLAIETEDSEQGAVDSDYIAAMHPGVGVALADWLDSTAATVDAVTKRYPPGADASVHWVAPALAVARAVLGEA
jgi:hypothetical protein